MVSLMSGGWVDCSQSREKSIYKVKGMMSESVAREIVAQWPKTGHDIVLPVVSVRICAPKIPMRTPHNNDSSLQNPASDRIYHIFAAWGPSICWPAKGRGRSIATRRVVEYRTRRADMFSLKRLLGVVSIMPRKICGLSFWD